MNLIPGWGLGMDPSALVDPAVGGVIGAAATAAAKGAWNLGQTIVRARFAGHHPKAQEKAEANAAQFVAQLRERVRQLEDNGNLTEEQVNAAFENPDFSMMLERAIMAAAQTESKEKQLILARIVADRLNEEPESTILLAGRLASDTITYLNARQLLALGFITVVRSLRPSEGELSTKLKQRNYTKYMGAWLNKSLKRFIHLDSTGVDLIHLESLSCIRMLSLIDPDISNAISSEGYVFDRSLYERTQVGRRVAAVWQSSGLYQAGLTSLGYVIGACVHDAVNNDTTRFLDWD